MHPDENLKESPEQSVETQDSTEMSQTSTLTVEEDNRLPDLPQHGPSLLTLDDEVVSPDPPGQRPTFSFADMLVQARVISEEQASTAQEAARRERQPLWQILVRDGLIMPQDLAALIALHLGLSMVDLRSQTIDPQAISLIPQETARRYNVLAINAKDGRLTLAMPDPTDLQQIQDITASTGHIIEPVVATPEDILEHIDISYRLIEDVTDEKSETLDTPTGRVTASLLRESTPAQIIDLLLRQAIQDHGSDIHISPGESRLRIRFRLDGILHDIMNLPMEMHPSIISRLKIMAGMNIAERRRPQDGQFTFEMQSRKVDVRVAISSTVVGEMAVLRLLDKGFTLFGLTQLGMNPQCLEQYRQLLRLPYGLIIVCGPTGAGKSTTLYASLLQMDRMEQNVLSLEDPVEYRISDVNQTQVHAEAGITFATQLRSMLRLDPDVILVGEVRDEETAAIASQAALTGHLVLTSIHANDSVAALVRLRDLGLAPYLIASSVAGVIAQRMVRVVCTSCQTMTPRPIAEQKVYAAVMGEQQEQFIYGTGCNICAQTGYRGRTGAYEILTMSDSLRRLFLADAPRDKIWEQAVKEGLVSMRQDGMLKVKSGITTPYEVMRVLFSLD